MTNDQTAMLARYGIDYAEAMERFCGNESLFARIAVKYLDDPHVDALEAAMASGDAAAAEREAHSLKGVAGNLSFVRLYDLARKGKEVERESRFIALPLLELLSFDPPRGKLRVRCSKGTYIRTLCHDLGQRLGCGGAMSALTRVQAGDFSLEDALTLGEVEQLVKEGTLQQHILPVDRLFASLPAVTLTEEGAKRARNGAHAAQKHLLSGAIPPVDSLCRVYTPEGEFLMTGKGGLLDMGPPAIFCHKIFGE